MKTVFTGIGRTAKMTIDEIPVLRQNDFLMKNTFDIFPS